MSLTRKLKFGALDARFAKAQSLTYIRHIDEISQRHAASIIRELAHDLEWFVEENQPIHRIQWGSPIRTNGAQ